MSSTTPSAEPRLADTVLPARDSAPSGLQLSPETLAFVENFRGSERFALLQAPFLLRRDLRSTSGF